MLLHARKNFIQKAHIIWMGRGADCESLRPDGILETGKKIPRQVETAFHDQRLHCGIDDGGILSETRTHVKEYFLIVLSIYAI